MSTNAYLSFLAVGTALVLLDGQIIYRSGRRYLDVSYGDPEASASMTRLVTVLFHLVTLGLLALLSTIDLGGSTLPAVVGRLGVLMLVLAVAHALTLGVLARIRSEQAGEAAMIGNRRRRAESQRGTTVTPVAGQEDGYPSPTLEPGLPYRAPDM